jgi:hypothetical protein
MKDGVEIVGATGTSYSLRPSICDSEQAFFSVRLSIAGETIFSAAAVLTVTEDASPPRVVSARGSETMREIHVRFNEFIDPASAGDAFNYTVTDANGNSLPVDRATRNMDGASVTLETALQAPGVVYTVTVDGVTDLACRPHTIRGDTASFSAFILTRGFVLFEAYNTGAGTSVEEIYQEPTFPREPRERCYISGFDSRLAYGDNHHEQYGARIRGFFVPKASGNYIFYLRSDDSSRLWFNPAGPEPEGKQLLLEELLCCGPFSALASNPQALTAGTPYYIEGLYKEDLGGDYMQVAAKLETDPTSPNNLLPISGSELALYADPHASLPLVARLALSSNALSLSWNSQTGRLYRIQFTDDLSSNWANLQGDILAVGTNTVVNQPLSHGLSSRFYRIQAADLP